METGDYIVYIYIYTKCRKIGTPAIPIFPALLAHLVVGRLAFAFTSRFVIYDKQSCLRKGTTELLFSALLSQELLYHPDIQTYM